MTTTRDAIFDHLRQLLGEVASDWDRSEEITDDTLLFSQLGFQSLDIVVLGTALQDFYQREMPFAALFADIGQRDRRDLSVGELAEFVKAHVDVAGRAAL
jgi:acyl carrier protein